MVISIELYVALAVICGIALILGVISTILGLYSMVKVMAMEKSTHSVQLMPVDPDIDAHNAKIAQEWATQEDSIEKQQKMYREDLEDKLPEFYEEDKEIISF